jgi:hypothetical protein
LGQQSADEKSHGLDNGCVLGERLLGENRFDATFDGGGVPDVAGPKEVHQRLTTSALRSL